MSSVPLQRDFINQLLTPAGETFTELKEINVKMEEEMEDQRRLMDFTRIPRIILHRIDLRQCWACKEDGVLNELSNLEGNSALEEQPAHQQFKEKQLCISQDEEQLVLKQETDDILLIPSKMHRIRNETEPQRNQLISHGSSEDENQDEEGSDSEDSGEKRNEKQKRQRYQKTKQQKVTEALHLEEL
ncbi:uncharacterized protein LOC106699943 isoform X3 [Xiphophorus maculatus]|uniref:uncharacterized protein LOC106699943 isoform X3 n=1 Tax=Xiphophorus maculatus TaxID=8083 RepID=UPI000C6CE926|nr:uncharacterized protein LOC106699943 isoform X3 [Xiphophorus maculatus]